MAEKLTKARLAVLRRLENIGPQSAYALAIPESRLEWLSERGLLSVDLGGGPYPSKRYRLTSAGRQALQGEQHDDRN